MIVYSPADLRGENIPKLHPTEGCPKSMVKMMHFSQFSSGEELDKKVEKDAQRTVLREKIQGWKFYWYSAKKEVAV